MSRPKHPAVVPEVAVSWYPAGHRCTTAKPADMVLVGAPSGIAGRIIELGEWLRPLNRPFSWTHHDAGVEVGGPQAVIIQETGKGAVRTPLAAFDDVLYAVASPTRATPEQRAAAVAFLRWSLGGGYGWWTIPVDGLDDLTGLHLSVGTYGRMVCSTSAARMAERWGLIPDRDPMACQPADNARYFGLTREEAALAVHLGAPSHLLVQAHTTLHR